MNGVATECYLRQRRLDRKTKELLFIVSMTALKLPQRMIQNHVKLALDAGVSAEEILEAIETVLPEAGIPTMSHGLEAWAEVVGARRAEPSAPRTKGARSTGELGDAH